MILFIVLFLEVAVAKYIGDDFMRKPIFFKDEELKRTFLTAIELGMSNIKACELAGISEETFYYWMRKAEEDSKSSNPTTLKKSPYLKFLKELKIARARFQHKHISRITNASDNGSWQASAWLLERRCPDEFALRNDINITNEKINVISDMPTSEEEGE